MEIMPYDVKRKSNLSPKTIQYENKQIVEPPDVDGEDDDEEER